MPMDIDNSAAGRLRLKTADSGDWTATFPSTAGAAGQVLTSDGSGGFGWTTPQSGSASGTDQVNETFSTVTTAKGASNQTSTAEPAAVDLRTVSEHDLKILGRINMAKYVDPAVWGNRSLIFNKVMKFASDLVQALRGTGYYSSHPAVALEVYAPPGNYPIKDQLIIPSNVRLNVDGIIIRDPSGGELADTYLPAVVCSSYGHVDRLNIQCHISGAETGGSGFAGHRIWEGQSYALVAKGGGYAAGQSVKFDRHTTQLTAPVIVIDSVDSGGGILTYHIGTKGTYDCHLSVVDTHTHSSQSGVTGSGAQFKVSAYEGNYDPDASQYAAGNQRIFGQMQIMWLNVNEPPSKVSTAASGDSTKGYHTGIRIMGLNGEINFLYCRAGRIGVMFANGSDYRVNIINTVLSGTSLKIFGFSALDISKWHSDTSWWEALRITGSARVSIHGHFFWENGAGDKAEVRADGKYANMSGYAVYVGGGNIAGNQIQPSIKLDLTAANAGGSKAGTTNSSIPYVVVPQPIAYLDCLGPGSRINIDCCNADYSGRVSPTTKLASHLYEFGNAQATATAAQNFSGTSNVQYYAVSAGRLMSDIRVSGSINDIAGPVYKGSPGNFDLDIFDAQDGGRVLKYGCYERFGNGAPTNGNGGGKYGIGSKHWNTSPTGNRLYVWNGTSWGGIG